MKLRLRIDYKLNAQGYRPEQLVVNDCTGLEIDGEDLRFWFEPSRISKVIPRSEIALVTVIPS